MDRNRDTDLWEVTAHTTGNPLNPIADMQLLLGIIISAILFAIGHYLQTMTNRLGRKVFPMIKKCGNIVWMCAVICIAYAIGRFLLQI